MTNVFYFVECSEFSDIFDLDHFKRVLANDVRIVSSLPSTHIMTRPVEESRTPLHASSQWIRSRYLKKVRKTSSFENLSLKKYRTRSKWIWKMFIVHLELLVCN